METKLLPKISHMSRIFFHTAMFQPIMSSCIIIKELVLDTKTDIPICPTIETLRTRKVSIVRLKLVSEVLEKVGAGS